MTPEAVQDYLLYAYDKYRSQPDDFLRQIDGLVGAIRRPKRPERFQALCRHCQRPFEGEGEAGAVASVEKHEAVCERRT